MDTYKIANITLKIDKIVLDDGWEVFRLHDDLEDTDAILIECIRGDRTYNIE